MVVEKDDWKYIIEYIDYFFKMYEMLCYGYYF